ncbi:MAG: hypothetical protein WCP39_03430 [Chlamydiota bacterium]
MMGVRVESKEIFFLFTLVSLLVIPYFHNQLIVGIFVNAVLFLSVSYFGLSRALLLGMFPSVVAYMSGLLCVAYGIPFIILGNSILCVVFFICRSLGTVSYLLAAIAKFLILFFVSSVVFSSVTLGVTMGALQLVTAIAGGWLASIINKKILF